MVRDRSFDLSYTINLVFTTLQHKHKVGSEEVRASRRISRQTSRGTTGGTSGSTSRSLKLSDSLRMRQYDESGMFKVSLSSRETMSAKPNILLRNSQLKRKKSFELVINASQACYQVSEESSLGSGLRGKCRVQSGSVRSPGSTVSQLGDTEMATSTTEVGKSE